MRVVNRLGFLVLLSLPFIGYSQINQLDSLRLPSLTELGLQDFEIKTRLSVMYNYGFKAHELPIFCKMEHLLQLKSRFAVRIRLGDVGYVNKLESKN